MTLALGNIAKPKYRIRNTDERQFVEEIIAELNAAETQESQGAMITCTRAKILAYLNTKRSYATQNVLNFVAHDLEHMLNQMGHLRIKHYTNTFILSKNDDGSIGVERESFDFPQPADPVHQQLLNSRFCLQKIEQGRLLTIGTSGGECYGIVKAMLDPNLSPYHGKTFVYNQTVYHHQKSQQTRITDQNGVQRRRLTREYFCPSISEQAKRLYQQASQQTGKEFQVRLRNKTSAHACYFGQQNDGRMRYMDPNYGAFLFDTQEQFVAAYQLLYADAPFQLYQISQLTLNPSNAPEKHSIQGKFRSLLTGGKYLTKMVGWMHHILNAAIGLCVGGAVGAIVGTFIIPALGTLIGAAICGFLGGLSAYKASREAGRHSHFGLLGPYHRLRQEDYEYHYMRGRVQIEPLQETLGLKTETADHHSSYTTMTDHGLQCGSGTTVASPEHHIEDTYHHHVDRSQYGTAGAKECKEGLLESDTLKFSHFSLIHSP